MSVARRSLFVIILTVLLVITTVSAQDTTPVDPPTVTPIPTDVPTSTPTDIPTAIPTETYTPEPSLTPLPPPTVTDLPSPTDEPSLTPSLTASLTDTPQEVTPTLTASATLTASLTASLTPSATEGAQIQNQIGVIVPLANPIACNPSDTIQMGNVSSTGDRGDVSGNLNSLSSDGRYLYFPSRAANLVGDDTNGMVDYFEFDRTNCQTRRITLGSNGEQGDGDSDVGNISGNGQYFAFASKASNFAANDTNGQYDIFVKNLQTNAVTRIAADPNNSISTNYYIGDVTISDDGHYVAFDVLVPANTASGFTGTPVLYNVQSSNRTIIAAEGRSLYISGDGSYIAFVSSRSDLVTGDTNNVDDVFVYERTTGNINRVSVATDGSQSFIAQDYPSLTISSSGRYISFTSLSGIVVDDTNGSSDVYVRDRSANRTSRISVKSDGSQFATGAVGTRISSDGRYVLFSANGIWIRDLITSQTYQITNPYTINGGLDISADGQYIAFSTTAGTSPNITRDAYITQRLAFAPATPTLTPITPSPTFTPLPSFTPRATGTFGAGTLACDPGGAMVSASVSSSGLQGNADSSASAISGDGRYIVFSSDASNLVPNDTNGKSDVFRFDRLNCTTIRVSVAPDGTQGTGNSTDPSISADGRYVAFDTLASNLVSGDTNGTWDVFVRDLQSNTITRIQTIPNSHGAISPGYPSISNDGQTVAFNTVVGNNVGFGYYSFAAHLIMIPSATSMTTYYPVLSGNGRYIAFFTQYPYDPNDTLNDYDVYLYDINTGNYERISTNQGAVFSKSSISYDGRYVTYVAGDSNAVVGDNNGYPDVFVRDRTLGQTTRISVASNGTQANGDSTASAISGDGRYVAFIAKANNLPLGISSSNNFYNVFVRDTVNNQTYLISLGLNSSLADWDIKQDDFLSISGDGSYISFTSYAKNLVYGDINGVYDVFAAQLAGHAAPPGSTPTSTPSLTPLPQTATQNANMTGTAAAGQTFAAQTATAAASATYSAQTATAAASATYSAQTATAVAANCATANVAPLQLASVSTTGGFSNSSASSNSLAISDTGRYVAFISSATNLVPTDTNFLDDVFLFDKQSCQVIRISQSLAGVQTNGTSTSVSMSANGQIIAFAASATNLIPNQTSDGIFVRNLTANTLIHVPTTGSTSRSPSISGDGRYVTYTVNAGANTRNIYLYDVQTDQNTLIESVATNASYSKISRDGSGVFYFNAASSISIYSLSSGQITPLNINMNPAALFDVSSTGRYIVFGSDATNLVANDTNAKGDVFMLDRQTSQITRVSVSTNGTQANNQSAFPAISPDGRYVSFVSSATNLVANDTNNFSDVFVRDLYLQQEVTYMVSVAANGTLGNNGSGGAIAPFSSDNRYIALISPANNLLAGDTGFAADVFISDNIAFHPMYAATATAGAANATATQQVVAATSSAIAAQCSTAGAAPMQLASVAYQGGFGNNDSGIKEIAISDTGRYVAFDSEANNLSPNDTNNMRDVFVFDKQSCQVTLISKSLDNIQGNGGSTGVAMSADGQIIAFASQATNLIPNDNNAGIYVRNLTANTLIRIPNTGPSFAWPSISGDGRYITYINSANGSSFDILLYDIQTGQSRVIASNAGIRARSKISRDASVVGYIKAETPNGALPFSIYNVASGQSSVQTFTVDSLNIAFDVSANGRYIVFTSFDTNLVANDTNNTNDAFLFDRNTNQFTRVSVSSSGGQANSNAAFPMISPDGRYVSFISTASNLVNGDLNNTSDIFVRDLLQQVTYMVSKSATGMFSNNGTGPLGAPFSTDNRYLAFGSFANTLVSGDSGFKEDVFIADNAAYQTSYSATATAAASITATSTINPYQTVTPGASIPCLPSAGISLVSVSSARILANGASGARSYSDGYTNISISDTGRYVVYSSWATNLVPGDTNDKNDLFIFDREFCLTTRLSVALDGTQANGSSNRSAISADGQVVVFSSEATNLIPGDANSGIFFRDFQNNTLIRIANPVNQYEVPSISADGRYITFPDRVDSSSPKKIVLYDRQTNQKVTIDTVTNDPATAAKISRDGSKVIYFYNASLIGVYDRVSQQKSVKSIDSFGYPMFDVSGDGRYVTFSSEVNNLVANDTNNNSDIFLWDRQTDQISLISVNSDGVQGNGSALYPDISADGRYVTFFSNASNLIVGDTGNTDVFVRDLTRQVTYAVSAIPNGPLGDLGSGIFDSPISNDNRFVVFVSSATNLVAGVSRPSGQVYIAQRAVYEPSPLTATQTAAAAATANAIATATYTAANGLIVNTTTNTDDGTCNIAHCSLVEAVNASNAMVGTQVIKFNIPGTGIHTITLSSSLILTSSAVIDGTTQPGYSGSPLIEIVPQSSNVPANAIIINGATPTTYDPNTSVTIRGLIINSFAGFGIHISNGQQHLIEKNYIGTDATGTVAKGNDTGIMMTAPNSIIRDNLISGNRNTGLYMYSNGGRNSKNNVISGNYIGTDATGSSELPNQRGIRLTEGASNNIIGGTEGTSTANVISGNLDEGILIDGNTTNNNVITGNNIGLTLDKNYLLGNGGVGISISAASNTTIGVVGDFDSNDIWGNLTGITVSNGADNTIIQGNTIAQNGAQGIVVSTNNTSIIDNTIMFHTSRSVVISSGTGNQVARNSISDNGGMSIDLGSDGITLNDVGDTDTGPNNRQNFPVITNAVDTGSYTVANSRLNSQPNQTYHLEFFTNAVCSAIGYGEGINYAGSTDVTTDATGNASFTARVENLTAGNNFGTNWAGTFFPSNNLTGTGVQVGNIQGGLNFNWGTGAPTINSTAVAGMPSDNFSARFTSSQNFGAGTYTFIVSADDGVRVYIDGAVVLDKFVGRVLTTDQFTVNLTAGYHALTVEYFEGIDQAALQVRWRLNGFMTSTATDANGNTSEFSACVPVQRVLGTGSYQENDVNLAYSGNWVSYSGTGPLGNSYKYTNDANAKMSFQVDNTVGRITFYRTTYTIYGATQIYLDGAATPFATMNNSSPTFLFGVPFTITIPPGNHIIQLLNVGSNYSSIDQIDLLASAQPLAIGSYQETEPNLSYSGNWVSNSTSSALGGARKYTNDLNATVSFKINNTVGRVTIYRTTYLAGVYGSLQVYVDNALTTTINNTSSAFLFQQPYTFAVTPGDHIITLRNGGSSFSDIDQITLQAAAPPLSVGTYQETEPNLTYSGTWASNSTSSSLGGARTYTNDPNGMVSFKIDNSVGRVTIYRTTYTAGVYGSMQVFVDGTATPLTTINNTSSGFLFQQPFTFIVTPGDHIITLKNVGTTFSDIDQITLLPVAAPLSAGTYQESESNITYLGNWTPNNTASALGGARIYTNDSNASVTFSINNTVGRVTIYRTTYIGSVYGTLQVFLDGATTPFTTISNISSAFLFQQPFTFAVTPGSHTITLKNVGNTYSDIDQITLEAAAPLTIGNHQESASGLSYNGTWAISNTTSALSDARKYTNDPNASVTFSIDNSVGRVTVYRTTYVAGVYGSMQVYLDNNPAPFTTINNTSSAFLYQQPFTFAVIPGSHIVTLKNVGSTYSDIDQITLQAAAAPLSVNAYQETEPSLIYNGTWASNTTASALGGARNYTSDPNGTVTFTTDNTVGRVTIYRTTYLAGVYGSLQVFLDNSPMPLTTINNTSSAFLFQQPFTFAVIPGNHIVTLKNVGTTFSDLDQITLQVPAAPLSVGMYQETEPGLIYNGTWTASTTASAFGGARKFTNDPYGTVSFTVDSSVGQITIYRTTYAAGVYGSIQVFVDGVLATTINNTSSAFLFQQPFTFAVVPGNHVITLKNVGSTYSDIDQITLLPTS